MPTITLKGLPTSLHRTLKARAKGNKRSLNQEAIALLENAVAPARRVDVEAMIADTRELRASLGFRATAEQIESFKREGRA